MTDRPNLTHEATLLRDYDHSGRHGDPTFVLRPLIHYIKYGELCACNGCHAEQAGRATLDALDREQGR